MKSAYFASVFALGVAAIVSCNDDEDRIKTRSDAGSSSMDGSSGSDAGAGGKSDAGGGAVDGGAEGQSGGAGGGAESGAAGQAGEASFGGAGAGGQAGAAGAAGAGGAPAQSFELVGEWDDNFGFEFVITNDSWGSSALVLYDNDANVAYTQHPADDPYNPNKFAKTVYTEPASGSFYFCMLVYSASTLQEAQASTAQADDTNPDSSGCGPFAWSKATAQ